jgi:uncharacterized membrane protein
LGTAVGALLTTGSIVAVLSARRRAGPSYAEARAVVAFHCVSCHSDRTTVPAFPIAAGGVELDTLAQMQRYAERIKVRVVKQRNMPLLNPTEMTDSERALLGAWVDSGARGP